MLFEISVKYIVMSLIYMLVLLMILIYYFFIRNTKLKNEYNAVLKRVEMDMIRNEYETKLAQLNNSFLANESNWKNVNHLIISAQENQQMYSQENSKVYLSNFLKNYSVTEEDLEVDENFIFVVTPFNDEQQDEYLCIKQVCENNGFKCIRSDEEKINYGVEIFSTILKNIIKAKYVVANINGRNPNVLYELGIAHALDKKTIIISKNYGNIPFDIASRNILFYNLDFELEDKLNDIFKQHKI